MSAFIPDASYTLPWCFADRAAANTNETLRRLERGADNAIVPWVWQLEVGNALGKAVTRTKVPMSRALDIWAELQFLPIRHMPIGDIARLLGLAVKQPVRDFVLLTHGPYGSAQEAVATLEIRAKRHQKKPRP